VPHSKALFKLKKGELSRNRCAHHWLSRDQVTDVRRLKKPKEAVTAQISGRLAAEASDRAARARRTVAEHSSSSSDFMARSTRNDAAGDDDRST
jgi:hypothetical protein